jgi:hypothetical protein
MRVRYRELALSDIDHIHSYLNERSPAGARKVIEAIHAAIGDVARNPLSANRTSDPTVRVKVVSRRPMNRNMAPAPGDACTPADRHRRPAPLHRAAGHGLLAPGRAPKAARKGRTNKGLSGETG